MGTALSAHDNLIHVRGWTSSQISTLWETLRKKFVVYTLTKEDYIRFVAGRNFEALSVFNDLDDDFDGRVDVFEVFVVLIIFSGIKWDEKKDLLFQLFDMMGKGFLKVDEVLFMGNILVQVLRKFVSVKGASSTEPLHLKDISQKAFGNGGTQLSLDAFRLWFGSCKPLEELRGFLEDHAATGQPDSNESRMRVEMGQIEKHATRLFERIERLQDRIPDFVDSCLETVNQWGRRKRWDFVMQNLRHLILKLHQLSEDMHVKLTRLAEMLNEDEMSGGMAAMVDPKKRFQQEQMLMELKMMRSASFHDFREATTMTQRLVELSEPLEQLPGQSGQAPEAGQQDAEGMQDNPRAVEARNKLKQICNEMLADMSETGMFGAPNLKTIVKQAQDEADDDEDNTFAGSPHALAVANATGFEAATGGSSGSRAGGAAAALQGKGVDLSGTEPTLVVIADFEPPPTHQSQMLRLKVGEFVTIVGQDGRGWWYGHKADTGAEGWFPPSYVQVRPAHHSNAEACRERVAANN
jgi:hypothetical protein